MNSFAVTRLASLIPILFGVLVVTFLLIRLAPGSPVDTLLPLGAPPEARQRPIESFELDGSVWNQFVAYLANALQGDFGISIARSESAGGIMLEALGNTAQLALAAVLIAGVGGVTIGVAMGWWADERGGRLANAAVIAAASVPQFWLGLLLLWVFALELDVLPVGGLGDPNEPASLGTRLEHLILPAVTVALLPLAVIARLTRVLVLELRRQDFVVTLHTRGYGSARVMRHLLRNAAGGVINIVGLQAGYVVLGTLFAEVVFSWPGIGTAIVDAINSRDYPVIQAIVLATGAIFATITVLVDLLIYALDPRVEAQL